MQKLDPRDFEHRTPLCWPATYRVGRFTEDVVVVAVDSKAVTIADRHGALRVVDHHRVRLLNRDELP